MKLKDENSQFCENCFENLLEIRKTKRDSQIVVGYFTLLLSLSLFLFYLRNITFVLFQPKEIA